MMIIYYNSHIPNGYNQTFATSGGMNYLTAIEKISKKCAKVDIYNNIIETIEIIIKRINGKYYIDWLIDFAEVLISYNAAEVINRNKLLELILMQVYEQKSWLEQFHLDMLIKLAKIVDLNSLFEDLIDKKEVQTEDKFEKYIGKTIGIYTLSESAGKNAKAVSVKTTV